MHYLIVFSTRICIQNKCNQLSLNMYTCSTWIGKFRARFKCVLSAFLRPQVRLRVFKSVQSAFTCVQSGVTVLISGDAFTYRKKGSLRNSNTMGTVEIFLRLNVKKSLGLFAAPFRTSPSLTIVGVVPALGRKGGFGRLDICPFTFLLVADPLRQLLAIPDDLHLAIRRGTVLATIPVGHSVFILVPGGDGHPVTFRSVDLPRRGRTVGGLVPNGSPGCRLPDCPEPFFLR